MALAAEDLLLGTHKSRGGDKGGRKGLWSSVKADWRSYPER